jgi:Ca-activated chloride channel family protein
VIVALARPRFGTRKETVVTKGVEIVVALDVSNSMKTEDVVPNRLAKSKRLVSRILSQTKGNKVALVVFAGDAFVQMPMTDDYVSAEMFLNEIDTRLIRRQGTDLASAITLASESFSDNEKIGKAIVLVTDAENHEPGALVAAKNVAEKGIKLYVMGVGTEKGGYIPYGRKDEYMRDRNGVLVVSKLNPEVGKQIASAGDGIFVNADNSNTAMEYIETEFDKLAKDEVKTEHVTDFKEQYVYIALFAFLLLMLDCISNAIIDYVTSSRKNRKYRK